MPEFRSDEWRPVTEEEVSFEVTPRHFVDLQVSCTKTVQVFGMQGAATTLLKSGTEFRFRGQVKGFTAILIRGTPKTPFGLRVVEEPLQNGEPNSGERAPVVSMPEPSNLLLKMRQMAREHHRRSSLPVLEPEEFASFSRYEVDDDEQDVLFEEEAYELAQEERKKAKAEAKARKDAEAKAAPQAQEGVLEPSSPKPPSGPPPAQQAAE